MSAIHITEDMIEAACRAYIRARWPAFTARPIWQAVRPQIEPALKAALDRAAVIPAGHVVVPVEPTEAMLIAGNQMFHRHEVPLNIYRAMIRAAAPQSEEA